MKQQLKHEYSDGIYHKRVAVLGNYPPPLGGVSVHIERVMHKLRAQGNKVFHFDTSKRSHVITYTIRLIFFLVRYRPDYVIYHTVDLNSRLIEFSLLIGIKKILKSSFVLVEHNCRHLYRRDDRYKKKFSNLMRAVDHAVLIGAATQKSYRDNGIALPLKNTVEAAFLPPDLSKEEALLKTYLPEVHTFLATHSLLIVANAFELRLLEGHDLYGFDQCIDLISRLKESVAGVGLILMVGRVGDQQYYSCLRKSIEMHNLHNQVLFIEGQKELWPLIKRAHIFVRPTLSDAESVSVQEALYFNVPVVASDVCMRPRGVVTFKTGNVEDFYGKINSVCNNLYAQ